MGRAGDTDLSRKVSAVIGTEITMESIWRDCLIGSSVGPHVHDLYPQSVLLWVG